ncbi:MAG: ABC transporter ATP-binding protein [Bacteroidota bacterium]|nr:ABC transporter ATP-binding protein [Bacteroidota bacterium]MDX5404773.1 ABC transporter ATP-binding protein [Bacteroidota bacterium]MDX5428738.1 ABC transporter ATP-binding protein [Bacteroidota bacterium]MDX5447146.1 ABC transporter ATP-binding protein [Bacteroidota bacterium]MDX5506464.1 ABC transporter ATP-binding protein [Bacteroidota bacterium]
MIRYNEISKTFGKQRVLNDVSLSWDTPGIYGILGPNGSGKTTLMKMLLGMVHPDAGEIQFNGRSIHGQYKYREDLIYLPQIARFPENLTVQEHLALIEQLRGKAPRKQMMIEHFGIGGFLGKSLRNLSGGMRQKVNLVGCFMYDAPVVIMDEPTVGLDPISLIALKELIRMERQAGKIILITTHILEFVEELADEVVFLLEGDIYFRGDLSSLYDQTETTDLEHAIAHILTKKKQTS